MDTIIVGIDGLEPSLVQKWSNKLPTLSKLMDEGSFGRLRSSDPPLSSPAWQWIFTGKQGGKHGVFGFTRRKKDSYERVPVNLDDVNSETLWEALDAAGVACGVVNVPETYPPKELEHGFMISGWPIPNRTNPAEPESILSDLESELGEEYKVNPIPTGPELDQFTAERILDSLIDAIRHHERAYEALIELYDPDVFFCVFTATDVGGHSLTWDKNEALQLYINQDAALGELLDACPPNVNVVVLSDHGHFAKGTLNFHINEWLRNHEYLQFDDNIDAAGSHLRAHHVFRTAGLTRKNILWAKNLLGIGDVRDLLPQRTFEFLKRVFPPADSRAVPPRTDHIIWDETVAYTGSEQNVIFLNTVDDHPEGIVDDPAAVREEIAGRLRDISHPDPKRNDKLVTELLTKPEVFDGPYTDIAPDIVFITDNMRCKIHTGLNDGEVFSDLRNGEHRQYGLLITAGPAFAECESVCDRSILDVFPLILALSNVSIPEDVDGSIVTERLSEKLEPSFRKSRDKQSGSKVYSDDESEEIREQLEGLGYLK